jgi:hypothetical protein
MVKTFTLFKDGVLGQLARREDNSSDIFPFEWAPKRFQRSIVVLIACLAHTRNHARHAPMLADSPNWCIGNHDQNGAAALEQDGDAIGPSGKCPGPVLHPG